MSDQPKCTVAVGLRITEEEAARVRKLLEVIGIPSTPMAGAIRGMFLQGLELQEQNWAWLLGPEASQSVPVGAKKRTVRRKQP